MRPRSIHRGNSADTPRSPSFRKLRTLAPTWSGSLGLAPVTALLLLALTLLASPLLADTDWPGLRGPHHDGSAGDVNLVDAGAPALTVGWKVSLGSGYSSPVVGDGRAITMFADGADDVIAAFSVESGEELWRYRVGKTYAGHDGSHDGPISTPLLDGNRVYALGPWGHLFALDATNGKEIWTSHIEEKYEAKKPHYGYSTSPVIADGMLVVQIGAGEGKWIAGFRADSGELAWTYGDDGVEYQSPIIAELGGRTQVVAASVKHLAGLDPATGEALWTYEHGGDEAAMGGASIVPQPAGENRLFVVHKRDGSAMLNVGRDGDAWKVEELWSNNSIRATYVQPVYHEGHIYGISGRILTCVDAATGERKWRSREPGDGFPTLVGDYLVIITKPGSLHVVEATPEAYREVTSLELFEDHSWSTVAYSDGHLFARSMAELARIDPAIGAEPEEHGGTWMADTHFGAFLTKLDSASDKAAAVEAFLGAQSSFPMVEPSGAVHFLYQGDAEDVGIVGDMIGFRREDPMTRVEGTDLFYYSTRLEPGAAVAYGFLPDYGDEAIADPRNPRAAEGLFGEVSLFTMPGWTPPVYEGAEATAKGELETFEWESKAMEGAQRSAKIYLPAGYANSEERYPVVYVHGTDDLEKGNAQQVLDHVIGTRAAALIAVFIAPDAENPRNDQQKAEEYKKMVATELVPAIDAKYRTRADRHARATAGTGSGATTAIGLAFSHPEIFGKIAALGGIFMAAAELEEVIGNAQDTTFVIYHGWGAYHLRSPHEAWDMSQANRDLWNLFRERGYRPAGGESPDGFGWAVWRARTDDWLAALFPAS